MCPVIVGELYLRFIAECSSTQQGLLVMTFVSHLVHRPALLTSPFIKVIIFLLSASCTTGESCVAALWTEVSLSLNKEAEFYDILGPF